MQQDIFIIGAGPVGLISAIACHQQNYNVRVITDRIAMGANKIFAINSTSINFLNSLGIHFQEYGKILRIMVTDMQGQILFSESDACDKPISYVIESEAFMHQLLAKCNELNIEIMQKASLKNIDQHGVSWQYNEKINTYSPHLILACDGFNSYTRKTFTDIKPYYKHYQQTAFSYVTYHQDINFPHTAYEVFYSDGSMLAMLPMSKSTSSLIWTRNDDNATIDELHTLIPPHIQINSIRLISQYPLIGMVCNKIYHNNIVLLGSSQCNLHPAAGQGLNLGIQDIASLMYTISAAQKRGIIIGNQHVLDSFNKNRLMKIKKMWHFINVLQVLFKSKILRLPRKYAMRAINNLGFIKRFFMHQAVNKNQFYS